MKPPNSEKPLIMKFFQCTICIHFNTFVPLNTNTVEPPNNESLGKPIFSLLLEVFFIERYKCIEVYANSTLEKFHYDRFFTLGRFHY